MLATCIEGHTFTILPHICNLMHSCLLLLLDPGVHAPSTVAIAVHGSLDVHCQRRRGNNDAS